MFLYQSGQGIVATGIGTGEIREAAYEGKADEEFNTPLSNLNFRNNHYQRQK